ncbi:apolipoprotein N-acyltransferase [Haloechinothrix sp. YIM 98757]|uniref:Apolipoprotein N-acyltransferase n=2 Tax=Haloechinothrix aidingensis TaxID=2752311 RepID=A0A837ZYZ4_9PSEU|nr:apolipoprotein N-acyltransferase [Haloechinothrix aidingensis]MBA0125836.1 apolipoprotein N-acyltransferase [Haloechinothrix aidingensis]
MRRRAVAPAVRLALSAGSGWLLFLSFPPREWWWLAALAFAGLGLALHRAGIRGGAAYGMAFGLVFTLAHLVWIQDFLGADLGPWPWLALSALIALFIALACAAMTLVARLPGGPVWMAALFVTQEWVRGAWPLNGFPWGRVAFGQPDGVFGSLAALGGAPLVSFVVVLTGLCLARLVLCAVAYGRERAWRSTARPLGAAAAGVALPLVIAVATWPAIGTDPTNGTIDVGVVQGNAPDAGLDLLGARETIRRNHIAESERFLDALASGRHDEPDLVVWPETATDVVDGDPVVDDLVSRFAAPALIGAMLHDPVRNERENAVVRWDPDSGAQDYYAKQELVPFSEYIPMRAIASWFTPFVDNMVDMTPGRERAVLEVGQTRVGLAICYESAYDYVLRDAVSSGAELLVVPTNNAWFGRGEMTYQHLAMSRMRAIEHGRATVVAATSGISAVVAPDGTVRHRTELYTAESFVRPVPLRDTGTVATALGAWPERILVGGGLAAVLVSIGLRFRDRAPFSRSADQDRSG